MRAGRRRAVTEKYTQSLLRTGWLSTWEGRFPKAMQNTLHGVKATTNLDKVLKTRNNTLPTEVLIVKAVGFPVVMYR